MLDVTGFKGGAALLAHPTIIRAMSEIERGLSAYHNVKISDAKLFFDGDSAAVAYTRDLPYEEGKVMREHRIRAVGDGSGYDASVKTETFTVPVIKEDPDA